MAMSRLKKVKHKTHDEVVKALMKRSGVRAEVEHIEREENEWLDALLKTRQEAGLTRAVLAESIGTHTPAVTRLVKSLATGKHSPSVVTLRRYKQACGKNLRLQVC